jgi:poly(A) polymerase
MSDPSREFAVDVVRRLKAVGYVALWAGGCVRDFLMGRDPQDYDVATNATPEQVRTLFGPRRTLAVGESFGVIIVRAPQGANQVEVATFRSEGPYSDGRRPDHVSFCSPEEDAQRRDFTINGMFFDPTESKVLDYVGGEADLKHRVVRAIGDPHHRIREDKLRMLRAVRFAAVLDFALDDVTADAVREMAGQVVQVSAERIAQELQKMLGHRNRSRAVELADSTGLIDVVFPELGHSAVRTITAAWQESLDGLRRLEVAPFELGLAMLLRDVPPGSSSPRRDDPDHGTVQAICRRLRLSNEHRDLIVWLVASQTSADGLELADPCRWKRFLQQPHVGQLLKFCEAFYAATGRDAASLEFVADLRRRLTEDEINPPQWIDGGDLKNLGAQPGPQFKQILDAVRNAQLNGEVQSRDEALAWAKRLSMQ